MVSSFLTVCLGFSWWISTTTPCVLLLGEYPFGVWKLKQGEWEFQKNPNMFIYDPIMCVLSQYVENRDGLLKRKDEIRNGLERLIKDNDIFRDGRKGSKSAVKDRIDKFNAFIQKYL